MFTKIRCSIKKENAKLIVKISQYKPEVWNSHERFNAAEYTDRVLLGLSTLFGWNKMHTMI